MESKLRYLEMVQRIVSRMANSSFILKGWSITLISGLIAAAAASNKPMLANLAFFPCIAFWYLDGYFLRQEKLFRELYNDTAEKGKDNIDFSMNTSKYHNIVACVLCVCFSRTLLFFHGIILTIIIAITRIV